MPEELYKKIGESTPDNLIAGHEVPILVKGVTLAKGQGSLKRGSVLGQSAADDLFYLVDKSAEPVVKRTLQITGTETKTAVLETEGLDSDSLAVYVGDKYGVLAEAGVAKDYTAAYVEGVLTITVVSEGALDGVAQCYIEIFGPAGANEADCILTDLVDTGDPEDLEAVDVAALAYQTGLFNSEALIFGGVAESEDTAADHQQRLRELGIFLKANITY